MDAADAIYRSRYGYELPVLGQITVPFSRRKPSPSLTDSIGTTPQISASPVDRLVKIAGPFSSRPAVASGRSGVMLYLEGPFFAAVTAHASRIAVETGYVLEVTIPAGVVLAVGEGTSSPTVFTFRMGTV